jgi:hypothetical protein
VSISFLSPILNSIANADATAQRAALQGNGGSGGGMPSGSADSSCNVVLSAQAQSAAMAEQAAQAAAANAAGTAALEKEGVTVTTVSFADIYKNQILQAVDPNNTGTVSETALEQQVMAGGGTQAQADTLYKAMDMNGDGKVSDQEFEDSIPDPFSNADFPQQFMQLMEQDASAKSPVATPALDVSLILGNLAIEQSQAR